MHVILLERVAKLGQIGDVVRVKNGYARNFLLPHGKALRATKENRAKFEIMKVDLETRNLERKSEAQTVAEKLSGKDFILLRQAGEGGQLYGSVSTRDIAMALSAGGFLTERSQIVLNTPIKSIGLFKVPVALHPEVEVPVTINVARNEDEAARQARGENLSIARTEEQEARAQARVTADKFFEAAPEGEAAEAAAGDTAEAPVKKKARTKRKPGGEAEGEEAAAPAVEKKPRKEKAPKAKE